MKTKEISYDEIKSLGTLGKIEIERYMQHYNKTVAKMFRMRTKTKEKANACIEMFYKEHRRIIVPQENLLYEVEKTIAMYEPKLVLKHRLVYSEEAGLSWREIYEGMAKSVENIVFKEDPKHVEVLMRAFHVTENFILVFEDKNTGEDYIFFLRPKEYVLTH